MQLGMLTLIASRIDAGIANGDCDGMVIGSDLNQDFCHLGSTGRLGSTLFSLFLGRRDSGFR